jgi:hypothetical protein
MLTRVLVQIPEGAIDFVGLNFDTRISFRERLNDPLPAGICTIGDGLELGDLAPATPYIFEFQTIEL